MKQFLLVFLAGMMIPYMTTLAWTGRISDTVPVHAEAEAMESDGTLKSGEKRVVVIRNGRETEISVEEFLPHVLAAQIPADFEMETLKAQAVLARTYIYREIEAAGMGNFIFEEALDMDARSMEQMKKQWGDREWTEKYDRLVQAAAETASKVMIFEGSYVEPLFCYVSSGTTRTHGEDYPYLKQAVSSGDLLAENYLCIREWASGEMARLINEIPGGMDVAAEQLPGEIQIVERDSAGYVKQVLIGQKTYTGEEVQYALGLPSTCYTFEEISGKIRAVCKGVGHGYGFSQFGANELAREGKTYLELLGYYFQNVEVQSVH